MSQSDVDVDFLDGLAKIIDSIEKSADGSADSLLIKDDVDHWCPDVQEWHTADHKSAEPPQVHINVADAKGDDPYKSENSVEKQSTVGNENVGGGTFGNKDENEGMVVMEDTEDGADDVEKTFMPGGLRAGQAGVPKPPAPKIEKGEYDQNTNLPPEMGKRDKGESIAEPFLRGRKIPDIGEGEGEEVSKESQTGAESVSSQPAMQSPGSEANAPTPPTGVTGRTAWMTSDGIKRSYDQPVDMLKIWASVDRELKKDDPGRIVDDLTILESFDLDIDLTTDDLVGGTLVYRMLTDRSTRPTKEWWEASINLAKSVEGVSEPGILSAFLYYESDYFSMGDFIDFSKINDVERESKGKPQDLEMMPNSSGGDGMAGLGMSADEIEKLDVQVTGPKDDECDD